MTVEWALTVDADLDNLALVREFLVRIASELEIGADPLGELELAMDEAVTNIIMHGYPDRDGRIEIGARSDEDSLTLRIVDRGIPFDPIHAQSPDLDTSPLERDKAGGFGVYLIRQLVDDMRYQRTDGVNELTLIKNFRHSQAKDAQAHTPS